jgi:hypothetical protein
MGNELASLVNINPASKYTDFSKQLAREYHHGRHEC